MSNKLTLSVALMLFGLGCGSEKINRSSASFSADTSLDFGQVEVTKSKSMPLTLTNAGGTDLAVETIEFLPPAAGVVPPFRTSVELPLTILRAETLTIEVFYEPTELHVDADACAMVLHNTSEDNPEATVQLTGTSYLPQLKVEPATFDFGEVPVNTTKDVKNVVITNVGNAPITVTDVSGLNTTLFDLNGTELKKHTFEPGVPLQFTLSYTPKSGKVDDTTLVLTTDDTVQPKLEIPVKAKGLEAIVSLCWHFEGQTETCIPRDSGTGSTIKSDLVEFGVIPEKDENGQPLPKTLTLTLKNAGNSEANVIGLIPSGGLQAIDKTSVDGQKCPNIPIPRPADFTFSPGGFDRLDPTGGPASEQQMLVTYQPHHECQLDIEDKGMIWIQAGSTILQLDLHGASAIGMARINDFTFTIGGHAVSNLISVENIGYGPLHISSAELVQGDATNNKDTDCRQGCATRAACPPPSDGNPVECNIYQWDDGPYTNVVVAPGTDPGHQQTNSGAVGRILIDPSVPGFGAIRTRACLRATTDDLIVPVVCGTLSASN